MRGSTEAVQDCTSQVFEGMLVLNNHDGSSWVAKWQRLETACAGVYAVKVVGQVSDAASKEGRELKGNLADLWSQLPDEYIAAAENHGVVYLP